jgi:hypothetical protein
MEIVMDRRRLLKLTSIALTGAAVLPAIGCKKAEDKSLGLWSVWDNAFEIDCLQ